MQLPNNTLLQGGKYKIIRFISAGGFGCTYEASCSANGKRVAIKELFVKDVSDRDEKTLTISSFSTNKSALLNKVKRKFLEEAAALRSISHPNIVKVFDSFEENGTAYYVMDYIDGASLQDIIKHNGALPEQKAVKYIKQVANALEYVHGRNRLHLDIKPGNIMIDKNDNAILIDFGVSKQYDEANGESTSTVLGKAPGYSPIEQLGNNIQHFTPATDIYALGATLYKCVTGNTPPDATTVLTDGLPTLPSGLSAKTQKAITDAMKPKSTERPQSIVQFLNCLTDSEISNPTPKANLLYFDKDSNAIRYGKYEYKFITLKSGEFCMGALNDLKDADSNELPAHNVVLSEYSIGDTVVPIWLWNVVMAGTYYTSITPNDPKYPIFLNKNEAFNLFLIFIIRLRSLLGLNFNFPTEAQWEYAARGGNKSQGYKYSGGNVLSRLSYNNGEKIETFGYVKSNKPNELQIYEMSGCYPQICRDIYSFDYYSNSERINPLGPRKSPTNNIGRVCRGGSSFDDPKYCRCTARRCSENYENLSLRLVIDDINPQINGISKFEIKDFCQRRNIPLPTPQSIGFLEYKFKSAENSTTYKSKDIYIILFSSFLYIPILTFLGSYGGREGAVTGAAIGVLATIAHFIWAVYVYNRHLR